MQIKGYLKYMIAVLADALLIWFDHFTKKMAVEKLALNNFPIIPNIFELELLTNRGAAFGVLEGGRWLLVIMTGVILCVVCFFYVKFPFKRHTFWYRLSFILIVAGGAGNLIDRVRQGYVVDFFYFKPINFPVFNMADIYVVVGSLVFIALLIFCSDEFELNGGISEE